MIARTFLIAGAALLAAAPAFAGGFTPTVAAPVPAAPVTVITPTTVAPEFDWTGFYAGGSLSWGQISSDDFDEEGDGGLFGVHAGYQRDFGRIVLGGELEYEISNMAVDDLDVDVDNVARAKLRLGYDAGRFLPYVTGGWARAELSGAIEDDVDGHFFGVGADYMVSDRFTVGAEVLRHEFDDLDDFDTSADVTTFGLRASFHF